jgi:hypothetical protein
VVILQLKKPWRDRTTHIELTPHAFLTRLASLVPRPRKNTSLYFGVLAGSAKGRKKLVRKTERSAPRKEEANWAALMKHSFGLDVTDQRRRDDGGIGLCLGDAPAISAPRS